jgi:hypothetical protein
MFMGNGGSSQINNPTAHATQNYSQGNENQSQKSFNLQRPVSTRSNRIGNGPQPSYPS